MATHRIPILGFATRPDDTGQVTAGTADVFIGTNDLARQFVIALGSESAAQPTVKHGVYGAFLIPKNYIGTPSIVLEWTATLTSGNVVFDFDYRAIGGDDAETLDPSTWQESVTVTDAVPTTARNKLSVSMSLTGGNFAIDDLVEFYLARDGVDASDTLAGRAYIYAAYFQYNDV